MDEKTKAITSAKEKPSKLTLKTLLPDWLPQASWGEWIEHRRQIKKPLTQLAADKLIAKLARMHSRGTNVIDLIDNAIASGWQGIYEPDERNGKSRRPSVSDSFANKTYTGTPDHELPEHLRSAI